MNRQPDSYEIRIVWVPEKDDWQATVCRNGDEINRTRPDDFDVVLLAANHLLYRDRRSRAA